jgi:sugar transferase (PEP-CTERM/EpsH1 system associated)
VQVLLLTHRLPYTPNRGDRIRAYHLFQQVAAKHDVHLVSLIHDADEAAHVADLRPVAASVSAIPVSRLARLLPAAIGLATSRPLTHLLLHSPNVRTVLEALVSREMPDVVIAYCSGMARYALERPLAGLPWLLDMVDVDSEKWAALAQSSGAASLIYRREARLLRRFEELATSHASATTVVSERERALLLQAIPSCDARVVSNGIDVRAFAPQTPPSESQDVVFCGVFDYAPNEAAALWLAREIWPLVVKACPAARLRLVGMNPTRAVRALSANPSIHVTGQVPDVRPYLWNAALSVAPLLVARGLQNKVLEALAAGLPCVVTPAVVDGLPVLARAGCEVAENARDFAQAVLASLRQDPVSRRARAMQADLQQLSWREQMRPMVDLVEEIAARPRSIPATIS